MFMAKKKLPKATPKCIRKMIISKQARKYERDTNVTY